MNGCVWWSLQNAYNLGLSISLTSIAGGTTPSGLTCTGPSCTISDLSSFCQSPNTLTGVPGDGCYNHDGTGNVPTSGTEAFATQCPEAYSYSTDNANHVYGCTTGSNYKVTWCPWLRDHVNSIHHEFITSNLKRKCSSCTLATSKRSRLNIYLFLIWRDWQVNNIWSSTHVLTWVVNRPLALYLSNVIGVS